MMRPEASNVTRRTIVKGSAAAAATTAAYAIGARSGRTTRAQGTEITFMNWDPVAGTPFEKAIRAFEETSDIKVTIQPAPTDDYSTKMRTLLASGSPPDVMRIDDDLVRGFAEANQLLDLTPYIESSDIATDEFPEALYTFPQQADNTHPAWVIGVQPRVIFYNKDAFQEAGVELPPTTWTKEGWTWDDFLDAAKKLTIADERWGALVYGDNAYEQTFPVNNGVEGGIYSPDGTTFNLASPGGVEAVQWVTDLTCEHEVQPPWSEIQQNNARQQMFAAGRVAMLFGAAGLVPYFRENVTDFEWDVAPVPGKVNQEQEGSLIVFTIPKDADNPDAAWELMKFFSGPEAAKIFAEAGSFIPANREAAKLVQPGEEPPANIQLFSEAAEHQSSVSPTTNQERAEQVYRPELDLVYNCEKTADEVLPGLSEQVEKALAGEF